MSDQVTDEYPHRGPKKPLTPRDELPASKQVSRTKNLPYSKPVAHGAYISVAKVGGRKCIVFWCNGREDLW